MKSWVKQLALPLLSVVLASNLWAKDLAEFLQKTALPATYLLFLQSQDGSLNDTCTATAVEDLGNYKYRFLTAAHCLEADKTNGSIKYMFLSENQGEVRIFYRAYIFAVGEQDEGRDLMLLDAYVAKAIPVAPLGEDPKNAFDQPVVVVGGTQGLGRLILHGDVISSDIERAVEGMAGWENDVLLSVPGIGSGASGSLVLCTKQMKGCGVYIGTIGKYGVQTAVPISRFETWYKQIKEKDQHK